MLLSLLAQVKGVPKEYSITYLRRWMAIHLAQNVETLWVNIFYINTCSHYMDFPRKVIKIQHRNFKLIYKYQVFTWKSHTLKNHIFLLKKSQVGKHVFSSKSYCKQTCRTSTTGIHLESLTKYNQVSLEKSYIEKSHFFTGKVLSKMPLVKTGIFLEKSCTSEHRNFKLIYNCSPLMLNFKCN